MLHKDWRVKLVAAASALTFIGAPVHANANSRVLNLRVGPGVSATISLSTSTTNMRVSCSGDADCRFDMPANSALDIVARGRSGHELRWTGCNSQPEANRCRLEARAEAATVTVR